MSSKHLVLAALLAGCSAGPRPSPEPLPMTAPRPTARDAEVVALVNGEPLTWRTVAEKTLELNLKQAVDGYVRWRLVEDRRKALGIVNTPEEMRRRAETTLRMTREQFGDEGFRAQLAREGLSEAGYLDYVAKSGLMEARLAVEKIVRYAALREDSLEIDRMLFVEEADAQKFLALAREKGFEKAAEETPKKPTVGRPPRERFPVSQPPVQPPLDGWIVEALLKLKPGESTGIERSRNNAFAVVRLVDRKPGRDLPYADLRGEILDSLLASPPTPRECERWVESEFARARIEYLDRPKGGGK